MKNTVFYLGLLLLMLGMSPVVVKGQHSNKKKGQPALYPQNRAPLKEKPYLELPLGSIPAPGLAA